MPRSIKPETIKVIYIEPLVQAIAALEKACATHEVTESTTERLALSFATRLMDGGRAIDVEGEQFNTSELEWVEIPQPGELE